MQGVSRRVALHHDHHNIARAQEIKIRWPLPTPLSLRWANLLLIWVTILAVVFCIISHLAHHVRQRPAIRYGRYWLYWTVPTESVSVLSTINSHRWHMLLGYGIADAVCVFRQTETTFFVGGWWTKNNQHLDRYKKLPQGLGAVGCWCPVFCFRS